MAQYGSEQNQRGQPTIVPYDHIRLSPQNACQEALPAGPNTITEGDTLSGIAIAGLGDAWHGPAIYMHNIGAIGRNPKIQDPGTLIQIS